MKFRKPLTITSRTSSVANGFVQAIIPSVEPSSAQRDEALAVLGMSFENMSCVYCGSGTLHWDHLQPLVRHERPTGYFNEIRNLVPSCAPCNTSKGGQAWRTWMVGKAKNSPTSKGIGDLQSRIQILERFESWGNLSSVDLRNAVGADLWDPYWEKLAAIKRAMHDAQLDVAAIRVRIGAAIVVAEATG